MDSFEDLGLPPLLVEALAAGGLETPTELQALAIPVLRRGHSAVLRGGPGAGVLGAYALPLLERIEPAGSIPCAIVLTTSRERARELAVSLAELAAGTGHRVGALGAPWAVATHADVLFSTPGDLLDAIKGSEVKSSRIQAVVLDGASHLLEEDAERVTSILQASDEEEIQIVVVSDPLSQPVRDFVDQHMRRAVFLPPEASSREESDSAPVARGRLQVRVVEENKEDALLATAAALLEGGARHLLIFARSEDRAADMGDVLALHGFLAGAPGDPGFPIWLGVDALEARKSIGERLETRSGSEVRVVSVDVPPDADELDRRHGSNPEASTVLVRPRELPHLKRIAREAGYEILPDSSTGSAMVEVQDFLEDVSKAIQTQDLAPYLVLLEPLIRKRGSTEVAAALAWLLRQKTSRDAADSPTTAPARSGDSPPAWVRIFLSIGERDGVRPGDVLGAITGETGVSGDQVGRIELKDTFTRVEVEDSVAARVIESLNGTSIRGRSVRADYDRGEGRRRAAGSRTQPPRRK